MAQSRYLPYGQERWTSGTLPTDFTFTGQRAERGFGLVDYNARYYDPYLNRFISPDSIVPQPGNPQAWNRYAYVANNPLKFTDSAGHCWDPITGSAAGCIAAWQRTVKAYQAGERRLDVLALHSSGITDRLVEISEQINRLNADAAVVFSDAPLEERFMPSVRLGIWATGTAATIVGVGQAAKAGIGALRNPANGALATAEQVLPTVETSRGMAVQATSESALATRIAVEEGATVYRQGEFGIQYTTEAQFWSPQNPASTTSYAKQFGHRALTKRIG